MIFATVGTQLPFERLIRALDDLAPSLGRPIVAQIGRTAYEPVNIGWHRFIPALEVDRFFEQAEVVVAHAGIGTILNVTRHRKPIVLMPRMASLGEHRNDHQLATVAQLEGRPGLYVARDEAELAARLREQLAPPQETDDEGPERERLKAYLGEVVRRHAGAPALRQRDEQARAQPRPR